jgi:hypothetical protein
VRQPQWLGICTLGILLSFLAGCGMQAPYMRRWEIVEGIPNRWSGGTIKANKLSTDETAVYEAWGSPEVIRFFRANDTRQRVYEWIYLEREQIVWFLNRQRVEYVTVDANPSGFTKETRETLRQKATTGGILGAAIGGVAAGMVLFGNSIGLRE